MLLPPIFPIFKSSQHRGLSTKIDQEIIILSSPKRKKKIAAAIYEYQADCDGEWGEISLDFENGKAEVILLADWDTVKTNKFASRAIAYLLNCENEKLPKEIMVAFE